MKSGQLTRALIIVLLLAGVAPGSYAEDAPKAVAEPAQNVQPVAGKEDKPDETYLAVVQARDEYDKGNYADSLKILNAQLSSLDKGADFTRWQILSDVLLCHIKLHQATEAKEIAAQCAELNKMFNMSQPKEFVLVQENKGVRATVAAMIVISGKLQGALPRVLIKGEGTSYAVQDDLSFWQANFVTGTKLKQQGRYNEAEPYLVKAASQVGEQNASLDEQALVTQLLGGNYRYQKRYDESVAMYKKALTLCEKGSGASSPGYATILDNLAQVYSHQGNNKGAADLQKQSIAIYEKVLPPDAVDLGQVYVNYAETLLQTDNASEAEEYFNKGIAIYKKSLPPNDPRLGIAYDNLAGVYSRTGRLKEAHELVEKSLGLTRAAVGPAHPDVSISVGNLAIIMLREGKTADARRLLEEHLVVLKNAKAPQLADFAKQCGEVFNVIGVQKK